MERSADVNPTMPGEPQNHPFSKKRTSSFWDIGPATAVLIGISIIVALMTNLGSNDDIVDYLLITDEFDSLGFEAFSEIMHGQVWRLLTPIFIHFGLIHLLFNVMWLKDLGTLIERRFSIRLLLMQVVVVGILSNIAQCIFDGPVFGGMSGVVYGLFGFVWIKGRFDPTAGFTVPAKTVIIMVVWLILCMTGELGPVANAAHLVGLVVGATWGFASAKARSVRL